MTKSIKPNLDWLEDKGTREAIKDLYTPKNWKSEEAILGLYAKVQIAMDDYRQKKKNSDEE